MPLPDFTDDDLPFPRVRGELYDYQRDNGLDFPADEPTTDEVKDAAYREQCYGPDVADRWEDFR